MTWKDDELIVERALLGASLPVSHPDRGTATRPGLRVYTGPISKAVKVRLNATADPELLGRAAQALIRAGLTVSYVSDSRVHVTVPRRNP